MTCSEVIFYNSDPELYNSLYLSLASIRDNNEKKKNKLDENVQRNNTLINFYDTIKLFLHNNNIFCCLEDDYKINGYFPL